MADLTRADVIKLIAVLQEGERLNLRGVDLSGVNLSNLDLTGANLYLTNLSESNLEEVIGFDPN
jgi:uncharacterized protein YjbI with pentapeptide repeats